MTLDEYVGTIRDKRIAVIGAGVSNTPLIELLLEKGCGVTVRDKRGIDEMGAEAERLSALGAELRCGEDYLDALDEELIFRTPGLMPFEPHLRAAEAGGAVVTSEMEAFFALCPCRSIAVTGSDGKTTTATIISELLKAAGYTVHLGGNIGRPLLCEIPRIKKDDYAVLELSSFQLHSMFCRPDVAVITNISPNHLDKHRDYQDYIDAKRAIYKNQRPDARLVLNYDDAHSDYYRSSAVSRVSFFSDRAELSEGVVCKGGAIYRVSGGARAEMMRADEIRLPGEHNLLNYLAAFDAVRGLVDDGVCRAVAMSFGGVEHRLEHVRELRGVEYINDSIGTSPTRTAAGLHALRVKPIVIAGGYDKHIPFDTLGDELCLHAKRVFLTGATAQKISDAVRASRYYEGSALELFMTDGFEDAVRAAAASAQAGDIVLLSPACAAFDRFKNFAERGKIFKKIVMELE